jgi:hypothetical protein
MMAGSFANNNSCGGFHHLSARRSNVTATRYARGCRTARATDKSFLVLFFKKEPLPSSIAYLSMFSPRSGSGMTMLAAGAKGRAVEPLPGSKRFFF